MKIKKTTWSQLKAMIVVIIVVVVQSFFRDSGLIRYVLFSVLTALGTFLILTKLEGTDIIEMTN